MKKFYINIWLVLITSLSVISFTGCATKTQTQTRTQVQSGFNYSATSNVPDVKIYCGYNKNDLKYCYTTPFIRNNHPTSLGWSNKYFQAKKEGYKDSAIIKQPWSPKTSKMHFNMVEEVQYKKIVSELIAKNDFQALKKYTDENPQAVYYITDESLRLMLTGPKGMKVGDVRKLIKSGKSEVLVISLIKRVKTPYKEFTLEEIELLQKMDLSDNIIAAMIDRTTHLLDNKELRKYQEHLLSEQKKIGNKKIEVIHKNQPKESNPVQDELIKQGTRILLDRLF